MPAWFLQVKAELLDPGQMRLMESARLHDI